MLEIKGLNKIFENGLKAVSGLDLSVAQGEIFALLGPNGAGKSTTIRICATLSGFDEGQVEVAGFDVDKDPARVRQSIGYVAQDTGVDYFLTGRENLTLQGQLYRMTKNDIRARIAELGEYFALQDSLDELVSGYSGGMRRKLDIASALMHRPKVLFLDEPTLGLDTQSRQALWRYITKLNQEFGLTILLTTHYLEEADKLSHRVGIIANGRIQAIGTPEELKNGISGDALTLEFQTVDESVTAFAHGLLGEDFVSEHKWEGNRLHVYVADGAGAIPKVMATAANRGVTVKTLSLARPSLDDVFIRHTGASMLNPAEEEEKPWWEKWAGKGGGKWQKKWQQQQADDGQAEADATSGAGEWPQQGQWDGNQAQWSEGGGWDGNKQADWSENSGKWSEQEQAEWASGKWSAEEQAEWAAKKGNWEDDKQADWSDDKGGDKDWKGGAWKADGNQK